MGVGADMDVEMLANTQKAVERMRKAVTGAALLRAREWLLPWRALCMLLEVLVWLGQLTACAIGVVDSG